MANTLTSIMPKILARGLLALRERAIMPRIVNFDYSREAAQKGQTIDVPIPSALSASDVTPSNTPPAPADSSPTTVQITLNNWKKVSFYLTDKELMEIDKQQHFIPLQLSEAVRALANAINLSVHQEYWGVYGFTGTPGTTPFASDASDAINARKILHSQRAPRDNRRGVVNFDAEANMLALATFADADKVGSADVKIEGEIGRKFGIDWYADDQVVTHTAGTLTGTIAVSGAHAAGATSVTLATDAGEAINLKKGDIITFSGHNQTYAVQADLNVGASSSGAVQIRPGLAVALSGGETVSVKGDHVVNLVFHRDAFALAMRPLESATDPDLALGSRILTMTDPQTGLSLRLEISRQYKQVVWELDALWGVKLVRPELAARIAG